LIKSTQQASFLKSSVQTQHYALGPNKAVQGNAMSNNARAGQTGMFAQGEGSSFQVKHLEPRPHDSRPEMRNYINNFNLHGS
jgi:hypothetical protein